jgi:hypothetical protein
VFPAAGVKPLGPKSSDSVESMEKKMMAATLVLPWSLLGRKVPVWWNDMVIACYGGGKIFFCLGAI